jgi:pyruvate/2-oxoacid:ferredoxin oxidoreductase beta subunit
MKDFDSFDRKSFRKEKLDSKKRDRKFSNDLNEEQRFKKLNRQNLKKRIQEIQEEERWEDWENEIS